VCLLVDSAYQRGAELSEEHSEYRMFIRILWFEQGCIDVPLAVRTTGAITTRAEV
jgi:hypothetical protein